MAAQRRCQRNVEVAATTQISHPESRLCTERRGAPHSTLHRWWWWWLCCVRWSPNSALVCSLSLNIRRGWAHRVHQRHPGPEVRQARGDEVSVRDQAEPGYQGAARSARSSLAHLRSAQVFDTKTTVPAPGTESLGFVNATMSALVSSKSSKLPLQGADATEAGSQCVKALGVMCVLCCCS